MHRQPSESRFEGAYGPVRRLIKIQPLTRPRGPGDALTDSTLGGPILKELESTIHQIYALTTPEPFSRERVYRLVEIACKSSSNAPLHLLENLSKWCASHIQIAVDSTIFALYLVAEHGVDAVSMDDIGDPSSPINFASSMDLENRVLADIQSGRLEAVDSGTNASSSSASTSTPTVQAAARYLLRGVFSSAVSIAHAKILSGLWRAHCQRSSNIISVFTYLDRLTERTLASFVPSNSSSSSTPLLSSLVSLLLSQSHGSFLPPVPSLLVLLRAVFTRALSLYAAPSTLLSSPVSTGTTSATSPPPFSVVLGPLPSSTIAAISVLITREREHTEYLSPPLSLPAYSTIADSTTSLKASSAAVRSAEWEAKALLMEMDGESEGESKKSKGLDALVDVAIKCPSLNLLRSNDDDGDDDEDKDDGTDTTMNDELNSTSKKPPSRNKTPIQINFHGMLMLLLSACLSCVLCMRLASCSSLLSPSSVTIFRLTCSHTVFQPCLLLVLFPLFTSLYCYVIALLYFYSSSHT